MKILVLIQNEVKVPKGSYNAFAKFKYRSAEDILEAVKPVLLKHEASLTLSDEMVLIGTKIFLKATATLTINKEVVIVNGFAEISEHKGMSSEQTTGTASSYARKYALNGLFLIDETEADADSQAPKPIEKHQSAIDTINLCETNEQLTGSWGVLTEAEKADPKVKAAATAQKNKLNNK